MDSTTTKEQRRTQDLAVMTRFRPEFGRELDRVASEEGRSRASLVRQAVRQYIEARQNAPAVAA
jgi:predicted transcriptional regulator